MSHSTYGRAKGHFAGVTDRMDCTWYKRMSHGTYKWVIAHVDEPSVCVHVYASSEVERGCRPDGHFAGAADRMDTAYMDESWHIWMSHGASGIYQWVMAHMNESCHTWHISMSHGPYEWVMSHIAGATDWLRRMDTAYIQPKIRTSRGKSRYAHSFTHDMTHSRVPWLIYTWTSQITRKWVIQIHCERVNSRTNESWIMSESWHTWKRYVNHWENISETVMYISMNTWVICMTDCDYMSDLHDWLWIHEWFTWLIVITWVIYMTLMSHANHSCAHNHVIPLIFTWHDVFPCAMTR